MAPNKKTRSAKAIRRPHRLRPAHSPGTTSNPADCPCDDHVTISHLKQVMRHFVAERQWAKYHTPRNLAAYIAVEDGELLELFQWLTPQEAIRRSRTDAAFRRALGEEMCDVMMYLIGLANVAD